MSHGPIRRGRDGARRGKGHGPWRKREATWRYRRYQASGQRPRRRRSRREPDSIRAVDKIAEPAETTKKVAVRHASQPANAAGGIVEAREVAGSQAGCRADLAIWGGCRRGRRYRSRGGTQIAVDEGVKPAESAQLVVHGVAPQPPIFAGFVIEAALRGGAETRRAAILCQSPRVPHHTLSQRRIQRRGKTAIPLGGALRPHVLCLAPERLSLHSPGPQRFRQPSGSVRIAADLIEDCYGVMFQCTRALLASASN